MPDEEKANYGWLAEVPDLREVAFCHPGENALSCLKLLPRLQRLEVENVVCQYFEENWAAFSSLSELQTLVVIRPCFNKVWRDIYSRLDVRIEGLNKLKKLRNLRINGVSRVGFDLITKLEGLEVLDLMDLRYEKESFGNDISTIKNLKELVDLSLYAAIREGELLHLVELNKLRRLRIVRRQGSSEGVATLVKALPKLERLEYNFSSYYVWKSEELKDEGRWPDNRP
jgi:hypothetical protein